MITNTLTDSKCKSAKPTDKAQKIFDGGGLHLWISPKGAKIWRMAYRIEGRAQTISFGPYPEVSLAQARIKRDEIRAALREGVNPTQSRRVARSNLTLTQASTQFWESRHDISDSYRRNAMRGIEMHLLKALGNRSVSSITRDDLMSELMRMDAAGLHVYVRRVRMWVGQVFDWAIERGEARINPAALINPKKAFSKAKVAHFASLELNEVSDFLQRLQFENDIQSVLACRLLALTWVRTAELRMMEWTEIEDDLWRLPAKKTKRRRDHLIPLSTQALEIIQAMKLRSRGSPYVFPSERRLDRTMSENTILYLLHRIGYKGRMTGHGWRTIGSTWANEAGHNKDAIERQLAHAPDDKVRSVYNRAEYLPERRALLQAWANWLDSQAKITK